MIPRVKSLVQERGESHHYYLGTIPYKYLVNFKVVTMAGYVKRHEKEHPFYITPQGVIYQPWYNPESTRFCYKHIYRPRHVSDGGISELEWYHIFIERDIPPKHIKNFFRRHFNIDVRAIAARFYYADPL